MPGKKVKRDRGVKPLVDRALSELMGFTVVAEKQSRCFDYGTFTARKPSGEAARQYDSLRQTVHEMQIPGTDIPLWFIFPSTYFSFLDPSKRRRFIQPWL
jgi:hypothetical protein